MKVMSAHQPDIFPYSGFFHKMNKSDYFDLAVFDEYSKGRYMDRVMIGKLDQLVWLNVPIERKKHCPINQIPLKANWKTLLIERIEAQYKKNPKAFPFYNERKFIIDTVLDQECNTLAEVGTASILAVAMYLKINSTINVLGENLPKGTEGLIELSNRYATKYNTEITYLSGSGGKQYMDVELFEKHHKLEFDEYETQYKCSILTPIFSLENPIEIIK